jgi:hypothetical protein
VDGDLPGIEIAIDDVGKRATDVDADRFHDAPAARMLPPVPITC